jgi:arginine-tRNA-protein transferase
VSIAQYNAFEVEARLRFYAPPARCEYLPGETARLECLLVDEMTAAEYLEWLRRGWRRFGHTVFRPACPSCRKCQSLRVPVASFARRRTLGRVWKANAGTVVIDIGEPSVSPESRALYEKFHRYQHHAKGWPAPEEDGADAFFPNPFPTEEWRYRLDGRLVAVGYVDVLPDGLSAIYCFHDPDERRRSLGTFNVLSIIEDARRRALPWVYLGYYVEGCRSVEYKARFSPNEVLRPDGTWMPFLR